MDIGIQRMWDCEVLWDFVGTGCLVSRLFSEMKRFARFFLKIYD